MPGYSLGHTSRAIALALTGLVAAADASAATSTSDANSSTIPVRRRIPDLPEPIRQRFDEQDSLRNEIRAADRKELVRPAPPRFKPEPVARKVRVALFARDKRIRVGETFWYRLELQNVGRKPLYYFESPSFLKDGRRYDMGRWDFYVVLPDGTRKPMVIGTLAEEWSMPLRSTGTSYITRPGMTEDEKQSSYELTRVRREEERDLHVELAPGETLRSRPWRWVDADEYRARLERGVKEPWPRPEGPFSELWTSFTFDQPGLYRISVVLNDHHHKPPDEEELADMEKRGVSRNDTLRMYRETDEKRLGVIESDGVLLEVAP